MTPLVFGRFRNRAFGSVSERAALLKKSEERGNKTWAQIRKRLYSFLELPSQSLSERASSPIAFRIAAAFLPDKAFRLHRIANARNRLKTATVQRLRAAFVHILRSLLPMSLSRLTVLLAVPHCKSLDCSCCCDHSRSSSFQHTHLPHFLFSFPGDTLKRCLYKN